MARFLPHVLQTFCNTPIACHDNHANMIVAALSGRLDISSLAGTFGKMEREHLQSLAEGGRAAVDARKKQKDAMPGAVSSQAEDMGDSFLRAGDENEVAVIQIYGTLTRTWGVGSYSGCTGYDGILAQLTDALNDNTIKGIWLDIDSGGGTVNGLFDLADTIYELRGEGANRNGPKPIYAMAADYAYSAAYLLGSSADQLFVPASGGVGSVGVMTLHASFKRQNEEDGIDVTVIREPPLKATATEYEDLDADTEARIREQCRELCDMFQTRVARNMGTTKSSVVATRGLDYMGDRAKAIGFVSDVLPEPIAWEKLKRRIAS